MESNIFQCPGCGTSLKLASGVAGAQRVGCPKCGIVFSAGQAAIGQPKRPRSRVLLTSFIAAAMIAALVATAAGISFIFFPAGHDHPLLKLPKSVFDDWHQDFEAAKSQAAQEQKDVLIVFTGSDWCGHCMKMAKEVYGEKELRNQLAEKFVPVFVDFPNSALVRAKVKDPERNRRLQEQFLIPGYPATVLADAEGKPFGYLGGYPEAGGQRFLALIEQQHKKRNERDELFQKVENADGLAKLVAAKEALDFLKEHGLAPFYSSVLDEWTKLARAHDADNKQGYGEMFFAEDWLAQTQWAHGRPADIPQHIARLDEWKKEFGFRDGDRAAKLHMRASEMLMSAGKNDAALKYVDEGLAYKPTNRMLVQQLNRSAAFLRWAGTGSGFVVAPGGFILTNHHVVAGQGRLLVRLPKIKNPVEAEIISKDTERDLCLVRVKVPEGVVLRPLSVVGDPPVERGERTAVFGYPLGDAFGSELKLTTGVVTGVAEEGNANMIMLDARINPGNSGGPVCDAAGNVRGMITAKSFASGRIESFGMAIPGSDLVAFLRKHLKDYQPMPPAAQKMEWFEVDREVSPSVLMVMKAR